MEDFTIYLIDICLSVLPFFLFPLDISSFLYITSILCVCDDDVYINVFFFFRIFYITLYLLLHQHKTVLKLCYVYK